MIERQEAFDGIDFVLLAKLAGFLIKFVSN